MDKVSSWFSEPSHSATLRILKAPPVFIVHGKGRGDRNGYKEYLGGDNATDTALLVGIYDISAAREASDLFKREVMSRKKYN